MSTFNDFFAENIEQKPNIKYVASTRIKNRATGKPHEWEIRCLSQDENKTVIKESTKIKPKKDGSTVKEVDQALYIEKLVIASVVFPNLKDAALQDSYHVVGAENVLTKMLTPGEYSDLSAAVLKHNDVEVDINALVEEAKN